MVAAERCTSGNWLIIERCIEVLLFKLFRLIFMLIQSCYWRLSGTARRLADADHPSNYDRSAQVLNVIKCHKFCELQQISFDDFLCTHNRFDSPRYILDNDHINLMTITDTHAVFCEPPSKDMHLWKSGYTGFIRLSQMYYCSKLIRVPLSVFHRMAESIGDPKGELIFIFNTARCGSTLLKAVLESTGGCVSISEPDTLSLIATKYRNADVVTPGLSQLARDAVRLECRPYKSFQPPPRAYALKIMSMSTTALPFYRELFPNSRFLFMYRDTIRVSKSIYRFSYAAPSACLAYSIGRLSGSLVASSFEAMGFSGKDFNDRLENDLTLGVMVAAVSMKAYLDFRRQGFDISAIRYEDLVARPLDTCRIILKECGLPVSLAPQAVKGLENDSQGNSPVSKKALARYSEPQMTAEKKVSIDKLLMKYGLPLVDQECILEGTISR